MTANKIGPANTDSGDGNSTINDQANDEESSKNEESKKEESKKEEPKKEESCHTKIKEFFRDKWIVILGIFIGLGTVQDSSRSSFQCLIKKLWIYKSTCW